MISKGLVYILRKQETVWRATEGLIESKWFIYRFPRSSHSDSQPSGFRIVLASHQKFLRDTWGMVEIVTSRYIFIWSIYFYSYVALFEHHKILIWSDAHLSNHVIIFYSESNTWMRKSCTSPLAINIFAILILRSA